MTRKITDAKPQRLSPELSELLHMLAALEAKTASAR